MLEGNPKLFADRHRRFRLPSPNFPRPGTPHSALRELKNVMLSIIGPYFFALNVVPRIVS